MQVKMNDEEGEGMTFGDQTKIFGKGTSIHIVLQKQNWTKPIIIVVEGRMRRKSWHTFLKRLIQMPVQLMRRMDCWLMSVRFHQDSFALWIRSDG
jgi:hypothetical protein